MSYFSDPVLTAFTLNRMAAQGMGLDLRAKLLEMAVEAESEAREQDRPSGATPTLTDFPSPMRGRNFSSPH